MSALDSSSSDNPAGLAKLEDVIELADAEAFATRELRRACLDGADAPGWRLGLQRLRTRVAFFGDDSPIRRTGAVGRHGRLDGQRVAYVYSGMSDRDQALTGWHEHCHGIVRDEGLVLACHVERFCQRFAAACVAPADSVRRAWRASGRDLVQLAALRPAASASVLLLRLGDVELERVALYDRRGLRHGEAPCGAGKLVELARREGYVERDGARAWRLPDDASRVGVLFAA